MLFTNLLDLKVKRKKNLKKNFLLIALRLNNILFIRRHCLALQMS